MLTAKPAKPLGGSFYQISKTVLFIFSFSLFPFSFCFSTSLSLSSSSSVSVLFLVYFSFSSLSLSFAFILARAHALSFSSLLVYIYIYFSFPFPYLPTNLTVWRSIEPAIDLSGLSIPLSVCPWVSHPFVCPIVYPYIPLPLFYLSFLSLRLSIPLPPCLYVGLCQTNALELGSLDARCDSRV